MIYQSRLPDRYIEVVFEGKCIKYKIVSSLERKILTLEVPLDDSLDKEEIELLASELLSAGFTSNILNAENGWESCLCIGGSPVVLLTFEYDLELQRIIKEKLKRLKELEVIILEEWED